MKRINLDSLKIEKNEHVNNNLEKSYSDLILSADIDDGKDRIYFLIEFQTTNDKTIILRLLELHLISMDQNPPYILPLI